MKFKITYFMKSIVCVTTLVMLMCWASQSFAQPTRAANTITPTMIKQLNEENKGGCEVAILGIDADGNLDDKNDVRHTGLLNPEKMVITRLGDFGIETKGQVSSRILQQPKLGTFKTEKAINTYIVSRKHNDEPQGKGLIPIETKTYRYYFNDELSPMIPIDSHGSVIASDWHVEDTTTFEVTVNGKKFIVPYNILISHNIGNACDVDTKDVDALSARDNLQAGIGWALQSAVQPTWAQTSQLN